MEKVSGRNIVNLDFKPLSTSHFPQLLEWLIQPHVKKWWEPHIQWTLPLVHEKYTGYVQGFKHEKGAVKKIQSMVIYLENKPIGYIQHYNAMDFARAIPLTGLPIPLVAFDMFIGEKNYLGKGIGSQALGLFLNFYGNYDDKYVLPILIWKMLLLSKHTRKLDSKKLDNLLKQVIYGCCLS